MDVSGRDSVGVPVWPGSFEFHYAYRKSFFCQRLAWNSLPIFICRSLSVCSLCLCVSVCLSVCLSVSLSLCLSVCLSLSLSVSVCLCLSVSLSLSLSLSNYECLRQGRISIGSFLLTLRASRNQCLEFVFFLIIFSLLFVVMHDADHHCWMLFLFVTIVKVISKNLQRKSISVPIRGQGNQ